MFSRTIRGSILSTRIAPSAHPPTFLLPNRARYFNSTAQHVESPSDEFDASQLPSATSNTSTPLNTIPFAPSSLPQLPFTSLTPTILDPSVKELLPLLAAQPSHYISAHIHGRPYLVTAGDIVRLPFRMPGVVPGDILRLNRASSLGSRDYTLKGAPYIDERIFECRARVMGTEAEPMRYKEKTKRRNRKVKTVKSKHKFTILRIAEVKINNLEDIEG
ncbi:Aconitase 2 [Hyphodiscus hymeniophilus]|uniref:Large ribosomal subunit protein bL21m n=1 Tax=Hyphodiscus hymeniophilus TaxID=353542 RepID=A0A9P6VHR0_9HELO|nr:Aconitase 2 [Hyphodiscus hymeniophilus]